MKIDIIARKYVVNSRLEDIIYKKLGKFDKYFDEETTATVICKEDNKNRFNMELTIKLKDSSILRSEITSDNMYDNIDVLLPRIERQIRKYKTKLSNKLKQGAYAGDAIYQEQIIDKQDEVVKNKTYNLEIMKPQDAIMQLDMIDNNFYVFINEDTNKVSVIYRRKDIGIGLINCNYQ